MGIVPIWGFQMLVAISLAFLFRLNKALVLIAANVSIPPMIPLILFLSHWMGKIWMGKQARDLSFSEEITFDTVFDNLLQYVCGAITLAIIAGVVAGLGTYGLLRLRERKES